MNAATAPSADFAARISACQARIEGVLDDILRLPDPGTERLREAMRYSTLGAGKRLRGPERGVARKRLLSARAGRDLEGWIGGSGAGE